jgi:hypothetical protein
VSSSASGEADVSDLTRRGLREQEVASLERPVEGRPRVTLGSQAALLPGAGRGRRGYSTRPTSEQRQFAPSAQGYAAAMEKGDREQYEATIEAFRCRAIKEAVAQS